MLEFNVQCTNSNDIFSRLFESESIRKLLYLYQLSNLEYTRNGRLTADVGMSREKDIIAYMKSILKSSVDSNIDNEREEDAVVCGRKVSIKHSSRPKAYSSAVKLQWTENKAKQKAFIKKFKFECDILLVYVRLKHDFSGQLEIVYFGHEELNVLKKKHKRSIFKTRTSNGRGIELSPAFFTTMLSSCMYRSIIDFDCQLDCAFLGPIDRRIHILTDHTTSINADEVVEIKTDNNKNYIVYYLYKEWLRVHAVTAIKNAVPFFRWNARHVITCIAYLVFKFRSTAVKI